MPELDPPRSPSGRDPALDGLRGVAILLVYVFHYGGGLRSSHLLVRAFGYLTEAGWVGVELFFVLSGFLITGLLADHLAAPQGLRHFFARRALRVLPLYGAALLAAAFAALLSGASLPGLRPLLLYVFFLQNLPPFVHAGLHTPPPLPLYHLWSLAVEEQFYLLWPLIFLGLRTQRHRLQFCLWIFVLSCAFRVFLFVPHLGVELLPQQAAVLLPTRAGALALGGALALCRQALPDQKLKSSARWIAAVGLLGFLLAGAFGGALLLDSKAMFVLGLPAIDLAFVALLALSLLHGWIRHGLGTPFLTFMGRISFGFYILHVLLEPLFDQLGTWLTHTSAGSAYHSARLFTAFPITTGAAWLSFTYFEQPFLRWKRRLPAGRSLLDIPETR